MSDDYTVYLKKRITFAWQRQPLLFDVAELLFSSHDIDVGTQFLLRNLPPLASPPRQILDLGCGYGPLGIVLAHTWPQAAVLLADKDLLAVHYAAHNVALNGLPNATVAASIGVDDLPPELRFNLIVSNVPGHIGATAIEQDFIHKPLARLAPGGVYALVIVQPLKTLIQTVAARTNLPCTLVAERRDHCIFHVQAAQ